MQLHDRRYAHQVSTPQPAEKRRVTDPVAEALLLGASAGEDQPQPRVALSITEGLPLQTGRFCDQAGMVV